MKIEKQANRDLAISQEYYIEELLTEFGMEGCLPRDTPIEKVLLLEFMPEDDQGLDDSFTPTNYQKGTGSLQYLVTSWQAFKHVLLYLKGTKDHGIVYKAGANSTYKSTSGYVVTMNGAPIAWRSQR
ncbi:hypothetical protein VTO42DRAFT_2649 [Malbranchea cinnamomea]